MADEITNAPILTYEQITFVVHALRSATAYRALLDNFQRNLVDDICDNYRRFKDKTRVSAKQWAKLVEICHQLRLGMAIPATPTDDHQ